MQKQGIRLQRDFCGFRGSAEALERLSVFLQKLPLLPNSNNFQGRLLLQNFWRLHDRHYKERVDICQRTRKASPDFLQKQRKAKGKVQKVSGL